MDDSVFPVLRFLSARTRTKNFNAKALTSTEGVNFESYEILNVHAKPLSHSDVPHLTLHRCVNERLKYVGLKNSF